MDVVFTPSVPLRNKNWAFGEAKFITDSSYLERLMLLGTVSAFAPKGQVRSRRKQ